MHAIRYDRARARLFFQTSGILDLAEGMAFHIELAAACNDATRNRKSLTLLTDIGGYSPASDEFKTMQIRTVTLLQRAPIDRVGIVAGAAAIRMRVRRMTDAPHEIFADAVAAGTWLGWDAAYVRALPWLESPAPQVAAA